MSVTMRLGPSRQALATQGQPSRRRKVVFEFHLVTPPSNGADSQLDHVVASKGHSRNLRNLRGVHPTIGSTRAWSRQKDYVRATVGAAAHADVVELVGERHGVDLRAVHSE